MEKHALLLEYYDKQCLLVKKLQKQIITIDLSLYECRYVFALKTQQFCTAIEDLLKQMAKKFLLRLCREIPAIRPQLLSEESFLFLDKIRAFCHFIDHAYDCELLENELRLIQEKISIEHKNLKKDFSDFRQFIKKVALQ